MWLHNCRAQDDSTYYCYYGALEEPSVAVAHAVAGCYPPFRVIDARLPMLSARKPCG